MVSTDDVQVANMQNQVKWQRAEGWWYFLIYDWKGSGKQEKFGFSENTTETHNHIVDETFWVKK